MPEEQDNQIERREPDGINGRSETARRGTDAADYVAGLSKRQSLLKSSVVREPDSPDSDWMSEFEAELEKALLSKGYRVARQVKVLDYRVDLAIVSEDGREYDLGIYFRGMDYFQPTPTSLARDAEIIKVLKDAGWHIHEIESKEWVLNPEHELDKLLAKLNMIRLNS